MPDQYTVPQFAQLIRQKHEAYGGVEDYPLVKAYLEKYPTYKRNVTLKRGVFGSFTRVSWADWRKRSGKVTDRPKIYSPEYKPKWLKAAVAQSATGAALSLATGEPLVEYPDDLSLIERAAATTLSFLMPIDALLLFAGSGLGGFALRKAGLATFQQLVKAGVKEGLAKTATRNVLQAAVQSGGALGVYNVGASALQQGAMTGEVDLGELAKEAKKGVALGVTAGAAGVVGGIGGRALAGMAKGGELVQKIAGTTGALSLEIPAFGALAPILEGRVPVADDFANAAGVILGMRGVRMFGQRFKVMKGEIADHIKSEYEKTGDYSKAIDKVAKGVQLELPFEVELTTELARTSYKSSWLTRVADKPSEVLRFQFEEMTNRIERTGGPMAKEFAEAARVATSEAHGLSGRWEAKSGDKALMRTRYPGGGGWWLSKLDPAPGGQFGQTYMRQAMEGRRTAPSWAADTFKLVVNANRDIGLMAEAALPGFVATGKMQRIPTIEKLDIIGRGESSPEFRTLVDAYHHYNPDVRKGQIKGMFLNLKADMDRGDWEQVYRKIQQEHSRVFKDVPSYIMSGAIKLPLYHDAPFDYLRTSSRRVSQRVAFLTVFGEEGFAERVDRVKAEMKSTDVGAVDDLVKTLHGLPTDRWPTGFPGRVIRYSAETLDSVFGPLMLSASSIPNAVEMLVGQTPRFYGYRNYLRGMISVLKDGRSSLIQLGAVDKAIHDYTSNPFSRYRTFLKRFRASMHVSTLNSFLNEAQESIAAATAASVRVEMEANNIKPQRQADFRGILEDFGFSSGDAKRLVQGEGKPAEYNRFVRKAATIQTGGNRLPAEGSRLQNSRLARTLWKFQAYPIVQARNIAGPAYRMIKYHKAGDIRMRDSAIKQFFGQLGFTTISGAGIMVAKALLSGGVDGLGIMLNEAQDEFDEFLADAFLNGLGGPLSIVTWSLARGKTGSLGDTLLSLTFPGAIATEIWTFAKGVGPYSITDSAFERGRLFIERVPLGKILGVWTTSLTYGDMAPGDQAAIRAYWRWRRDFDLPTYTRAGGEDEDKRFRIYMSRAAKAIKAEDLQGTSEALRTAFGLSIDERTEAEAVSRIQSSLRGRRLLTPQRLGLRAEDAEEYYKLLESLRKRVGDKAYMRLATHDSLLDAVVDAMGPVRAK